MTLFGQTLVLYLVIGTGVAGAVFLTWGSGGGTSRWFVVATAVLFWPLYLPMLLTRGTDVREPSAITTAPQDALTAAIAQVDAELEAALGCLDGWAEDVLAREKDRIRLQPANPAYPPMYFEDVRIQGKLIGVIRRLD